jgi:hypothetical protein
MRSLIASGAQVAMMRVCTPTLPLGLSHREFLLSEQPMV